METKKKTEESVKTDDLSSTPPAAPSPVVVEPTVVEATTPAAPVIDAAASVQSPPVQAPVSPPPAPPMAPVHKSNKLLWLLLVILAFVLAALLYVFLNGSFLGNITKQSSLTPVTVSNPTVVPSPTLTVEQQLQSADVGSPESDIQKVKTDLQGLK